MSDDDAAPQYPPYLSDRVYNGIRYLTPEQAAVYRRATQKQLEAARKAKAEMDAKAKAVVEAADIPIRRG